MQKNCKKCGVIIPPKRIEILPNTITCVNCSSTKPVLGVNVQRGTGEDTWIETIIIPETTREEIFKLLEVTQDSEEFNFDEDEEETVK